MEELTVVMYHYVRKSNDYVRYPGINSLDNNLFKQQIEFINERYNIIKMEELIAFYNESYDLPQNPILLTFDDGYADHFSNVFPVLEKYKIQGSFFIPGKILTGQAVLDVNKIHFILASAKIEELVETLQKLLDYYRGGGEFLIEDSKTLFEQYAIANRFDCKEIIYFKRVLQFVLPERLRSIIIDQLFNKYVGCSEKVLANELYLSAEQLECMRAAKMHIGCHGYEHYWLNQLSLKELQLDIEKGIECLSPFMDLKNWTISYPYGSYSNDVINYLMKSGCKLGVATEVGINNRYTNRYKLLRLDTNDFPPKSSEYLKY